MPFNDPLTDLTVGASISTSTHGTWGGGATSGIVGSANGVVFTGNTHFFAIQSSGVPGNSFYVQGTLVVTNDAGYLGIAVTNAAGTDGFALCTNNGATGGNAWTLTSLAGGLGGGSAPVSGGTYGTTPIAAGEHTIGLRWDYSSPSGVPTVTLTATIDGTQHTPIVLTYNDNSDNKYAAIYGYGAGAGNVALKDFVAYDPTGPTTAINPTTASTGATGVAFTMTGTGTSWTSSTSPVLMGGTGASIVSHTTNYSASPQTITGTFNPGSSAGTLVFYNTTDASAANVAVSAGSPSPSVSPTTATINVSATTTLTASNFTGGTVTWSSSNTSVATVNSSTGVVTGVGAGTCNIIATGVSNTGQTAACAVTVQAVQALTISPSSIPIGKVTTVTVTGPSGSNWQAGYYGVYPTIVSGSTTAGFSDVVNASAATSHSFTADLYAGYGATGNLQIGNTTDGVQGVIALTSAVIEVVINYLGASLFAGYRSSGFGTNGATRLVACSTVLGPTASVINLGNSGDTYAQIGARVSSGLVPTYVAGALNVVMLDGGALANVIANIGNVNGTGSGYSDISVAKSQFTALCAQIKALPGKTYKLIFCCSPPAAYPNGTYPYNYDVIRNQFNAWVVANAAALGIDAISAAGYLDSRVGISGCENNGTYFYTDLTHTVDAGSAILGTGDGYTVLTVMAGTSLVVPVSTDPGEANVAAGTTYTFEGTVMTGTFEGISLAAIMPTPRNLTTVPTGQVTVADVLWSNYGAGAGRGIVGPDGSTYTVETADGVYTLRTFNLNPPLAPGSRT